MANGDQYTLNVDFWAPLQANDDGKYSVVGRFAKGDTLEGVNLDSDFLEKATSGPRPLLLKKDSQEAEKQSPPLEGAVAQSTPQRGETAKKQ